MFDVGMIPRTHRGKIGVTAETLDRIVASLWPGDVIIKWADNSFTASVIESVQTRHGYPPQAPKATHVSMYTGENEVFHATFSLTDAMKSRTRLQSLAEYYLGHDICIGRYEPVDLPKTASVRARLVEQCKQMADQPYRLDIAFWGELEGAGFGPSITRLAQDQRDRISQQLGQGQICSTALFEVFKKVLGRSSPIRLGIAAGGPYIMPADFFVSPRLVQVDIARA